jgi:general secretion pathway protein L
LLLALAALIAPVVIKREAVSQVLPWVEKGKRAAEATDSLRKELESRVAEHNYLLKKKQELPPVVLALEELTRILPDDTWVQQLDIKGTELQIQGETASSSKLIGLFEQSKMFHDAGFRSPLTKGQGASAEHYQLAAELRPVPIRPPETPASAPMSALSSPKMPEAGTSQPVKTGAMAPATAPASAPQGPASPAPAAAAPALVPSSPHPEAAVKPPEPKTQAPAPVPEKKP